MTRYYKLITAMGNHSIEQLPLEACGIITKNFEYIPCKNISNEPKKSFIIDPFSILKYKNSIWGFFHSHPYAKDPTPSNMDEDMLLHKNFRFIVGFNNNFYIYFKTENKVKFERFNESHCRL